MCPYRQDRVYQQPRSDKSFPSTTVEILIVYNYYKSYHNLLFRNLRHRMLQIIFSYIHPTIKNDYIQPQKIRVTINQAEATMHYIVPFQALTGFLSSHCCHLVLSFLVFSGIWQSSKSGYNFYDLNIFILMAPGI